MIGNPPFGKNSSIAVKFFNHAARQAEVIAFILPASFQKVSIQNRLDFSFDLLHEEPVPSNAFVFEGEKKDVPTVFQIWGRPTQRRKKRAAPTSHPDLEFVSTPLAANFLIQRVGAKAGQVHHEFSASKNTHHLLRSTYNDVEGLMISLQSEFVKVAKRTAGNPSLAKHEIIDLYQQIAPAHCARVTSCLAPAGFFYQLAERTSWFRISGKVTANSDWPLWVHRRSSLCTSGSKATPRLRPIAQCMSPTYKEA